MQKANDILISRLEECARGFTVKENTAEFSEYKTIPEAFYQNKLFDVMLNFDS